MFEGRDRPGEEGDMVRVGQGKVEVTGDFTGKESPKKTVGEISSKT